jgi:hypothetical protein
MTREKKREEEGAAFEAIIGVDLALQRGDNRKQIDQMKAHLDELRDAKRDENIARLETHGFVPKEDE